jgi:hypothetical protein
MNNVVHARLDPETQKILMRLKRRYGWSDSEVVRHGIRAVGEAKLAVARQRKKRIVGLGKFASGIADLGSNKERLRGFGG